MHFVYAQMWHSALLLEPSWSGMIQSVMCVAVWLLCQWTNDLQKLCGVKHDRVAVREKLGKGRRREGKRRWRWRRVCLKPSYQLRMLPVVFQCSWHRRSLPFLCEALRQLLFNLDNHAHSGRSFMSAVLWTDIIEHVCSVGNASELYVGRVRFDSRPLYQLSW
jgi:hypothetical protein